MDAIRKILKHEGPLALYNGLEATVWRHAAWNGGYFGVIFGVKDLLPKPKVRRINSMIVGFMMLTIAHRPRMNSWSTTLWLVRSAAPLVQS